nr:hotdog domain-containing protein [uncultured Roseateles sp.]
MNHEMISQICFAEIYVVPSHQTARSLFTRLPHGQAYAETLVECIATGYLIAVLESICIKAMQEHIDPAIEVVVGRNIRVEHRGPIPPGCTMRVSGWVEQIGNRSATFRVIAHDAHERVCDGQVTLVAARRALIESRIASKVDSLSASGPLAVQQRDLAR